ncbi:hypothetical protein GCWU000324_03177 [Kingella oralis ATCC 51147]|uniref:Uncharacterized protein n=1 Tax=Kingella oralis ATCC 51147 TaxID=629741 RepID=C4GN87_9NEIS|nr:hypothetical protein GCWU000324_03177 [Kingella oralis ATCC 51147]
MSDDKGGRHGFPLRIFVVRAYSFSGCLGAAPARPLHVFAF